MSKKPPIFAQSRGGGDGGFSVFGAQGGLSAFGQAQSFRYATNSVTPACPSGTDKRTFVQPTGFFLRDTPKGRALSKLV